MSVDRWLSGDGGPLVIMPISACTWWDGAANFENSLMQGGTVETTYDLVCSPDAGAVITIRGANVLVADDSSGVGAFVIQDGRLLFVQLIAAPDELYEDEVCLTAYLRDRLQGEPDLTTDILLEDNAIRLLVGADTGDGEVWGYRDAQIRTKGKRTLRIFIKDWDVLVVDFGAP